MIMLCSAFCRIVLDQFWSQFSSHGQFNGEVNYTPNIDLTAMNGTPPDVTVNVEQQDAQVCIYVVLIVG
jgi:hypothetical protein